MVCPDIFYKVVPYVDLRTLCELIFVSKEIGLVVKDTKLYKKLSMFGKYDHKITFKDAFEMDSLFIAKWLYSFGNIDIHMMEEYIFRLCCEYGHLEVAKWLYSLGNINIHINNEAAFRYSCGIGQLHVAKWLYSLEYINIHTMDDDAFLISCEKGHFEVAKW